MKPGDLVLTNFFGESHKVCLILEQYSHSAPHPLGYFLILLPDGKKKCFCNDTLLSIDEYEGCGE